MVGETEVQQKQESLAKVITNIETKVWDIASHHGLLSKVEIESNTDGPASSSINLKLEDLLNRLYRMNDILVSIRDAEDKTISLIE